MFKDKKILNTAVFFGLMYWLLFYILIIRKKIWFPKLTWQNLTLVVMVFGIMILCSRFLVPVFLFISKMTGYLGNFIFLTLSTVIFFMVLTPIAISKKFSKNKMIADKFNPHCQTYFEEWEKSEDVTKQY